MEGSGGGDRSAGPREHGIGCVSAGKGVRGEEFEVLQPASGTAAYVDYI
jgi:hypothetical protein